MFQREMTEAKPVPPLVFNLALVKAARWHSYYQVLHGMTHYEDAGKQGFVARDTQTRLHLVGFDLKQGETAGENVFSTNQQAHNQQPANLWASHLLLVVHLGGGPHDWRSGHRARRHTARAATYSGRMVSWDEAVKSSLRLAPARYALDAAPPVLPDAKATIPPPCLA